MLENHFYSSDLKRFPIHSDLGCNIDIEFEGVLYRTMPNLDKNGYRTADFRITSFQMAGGRHFYGSVRYGTYTWQVGTDISVYRPGLVIPDDAKDVLINILRPVEQWEVDSGEILFANYPRYEMGTLNNAFYSEEVLIDTFRKCVPEMFKGKWAIRCDYWDEDPETIHIDN